MNVESAITTLVAAAGIIATAIKWKKGDNIDKIFYNSIVAGKTKVQKLAYGFRVANVGVLLKKYVKYDLIDGEPEMLDALETFLRSKISEAQKKHPITNLTK